MTGEVRQKKTQLHRAHYITRQLISLFHGSNCCTSFFPLSWNLPSYKFQSSEDLTESVGFLVHMGAPTDGEESPLPQASIQTQCDQSLHLIPSPMVCLQILHHPGHWWPHFSCSTLFHTREIQNKMQDSRCGLSSTEKKGILYNYHYSKENAFCLKKTRGKRDIECRHFPLNPYSLQL